MTSLHKRVIESHLLYQQNPCLSGCTLPLHPLLPGWGRAELRCPLPSPWVRLYIPLSLLSEGLLTLSICHALPLAHSSCFCFFPPASCPGGGSEAAPHPWEVQTAKKTKNNPQNHPMGGGGSSVGGGDGGRWGSARGREAGALACHRHGGRRKRRSRAFPPVTQRFAGRAASGKFLFESFPLQRQE